jgi:hypothetical protein
MCYGDSKLWDGSWPQEMHGGSSGKIDLSLWMFWVFRGPQVVRAAAGPHALWRVNEATTSASSSGRRTDSNTSVCRQSEGQGWKPLPEQRKRLSLVASLSHKHQNGIFTQLSPGPCLDGVGCGLDVAGPPRARVM